MKIVYCDGIFDLFHHGHLRHLEQIHLLFDEPIELVVGVVSDAVATGYKRVPIVNEHFRLAILQACIYVDRAFITDVLVMDEVFLQTHHIDYVVHAFTKEDKETQREFFRIPIELGKFIEMDYNVGISTSQIIRDYGLHNSSASNVLTESASKYEIQPTDRVLIVGQYIGNVGSNHCICLDTNQSRAARDITNAQYPIVCLPLDARVFKTDYFDHILLSQCNVDILPDEIIRVAKRSLLIVM
jgi:cytidyltransferase-like protein